MAIRFPDITRARLNAALAQKADWTPKVIPAGGVLHVPTGEQLLFAEEIELEGDAVIELDGDLVGVS